MSIKKHLKLCCSVCIILFLSSCQSQVVEGCEKFINEEYSIKEEDIEEMVNVVEYRDTLLKKFEETPIDIDNASHSAYHLIFYSAHGYGSSVKFEQKRDEYFIKYKSISKTGWFERENYELEIDKERWETFENMIYEFDYWTAEHFRSNNNVLDGFVYILEAVRPEAEKCDKRAYQLVARGSPLYDKIGALCTYILEFEERLAPERR